MTTTKQIAEKLVELAEVATQGSRNINEELSNELHIVIEMDNADGCILLERHINWQDQTDMPNARLITACDPASITRLANRVLKLEEALNKMDIVLNRDADHICKCYCREYPKRHPRCQYHDGLDIIRKALREEE